jgi:hypothetical protein
LGRGGNTVPRQSFWRRFLQPVGTVVLVWAVMSVVYLDGAWRLEPGALRSLLAFSSAVLLLLSLGFGALYIYPVAFFRGASTGERLAACLVTPLVWNLKEMLRVGEFFSFGETLYYGLNTAFLLAAFGSLGLAGLCELVCRWRLGQRSEQPVRILSPAPLAWVGMGLAAVYLLILWGLGVHFFYIYIQGYKALFT